MELLIKVVFEWLWFSCVLNLHILLIIETRKKKLGEAAAEEIIPPRMTADFLKMRGRIKFGKKIFTTCAFKRAHECCENRWRY